MSTRVQEISDKLSTFFRPADIEIIWRRTISWNLGCRLGLGGMPPATLTLPDDFQYARALSPEEAWWLVVLEYCRVPMDQRPQLLVHPCESQSGFEIMLIRKRVP